MNRSGVDQLRGRRADGLLRVGFPGDRRDSGCGRWWKGGAPGGAFADRGHPCAGRLLRDDGRLPADPGGGAVDRRPARPAVAPGAVRPGGDTHAQRGDPAGPRRDRHPRGSGVGDHALAGPARRAGRLRRPIQRDGGGLAERILRGPARHLPERRGSGGGPPARQPMLGLALHRARSHLSPAERLRAPEGPDGRGRAADGLPAGGRHPVHRRPRHLQPEGRLRGGQLRPRRGPGLRPGERRRLQGARRRGHRQGARHQAACHPRRAGGRDAGTGDRAAAPGAAGADGRTGRATRATGPADRSALRLPPGHRVVPRSTMGSGSSRAGRSPRCSPSPRPATERTTSTSPSATSR